MTAASALTETLAHARRLRWKLASEVGCPHESLKGCAAMDGVVAALVALQGVHADLPDALEGIVDQIHDMASDTAAHWLKRMAEGRYVAGDDAWKYEEHAA